MSAAQNQYYFDWAATAVPDTDILRDALEKSITCFANPSSLHSAGSVAKQLLQECRERSAKALKVKAETLVFTSGGTEANHLPILSLLQRPNRGSILMSAIEHPAIHEQVRQLAQAGWKTISVKPEADGIVNPERLVEQLEADTALVCVMAVNNETGAIQPIKEIADELTRISAGKKRAKLHVDAVQAIGKIPFELHHPGIDTAALSAHKIGGPRGIGLMYMRQRQEPFVRGGDQEGGLRPGTENLFGALALAACLEKHALTPATLAWKRFSEQQKWTEQFIQDLLHIEGCQILPQERLHAPQKYSPWIVQAAFNGIPGEVLVRALNEKNCHISTGSACSSRKLSRPVLEAMGIPPDVSSQGVRFSFGYTTSQKEMEVLLAALKEIRQVFKSG